MLPNELRRADYPEFKALLDELKATLEVCTRSLDELHRAARRQRKVERSALDEAFAQVRVREQVLRASLVAAQNAPPEKARALQSQVAAAYEAYSRAVTVAEATARSSPAGHTALRP